MRKVPGSPRRCRVYKIKYCNNKVVFKKFSDFKEKFNKFVKCGTRTYNPQVTANNVKVLLAAPWGWFILMDK